MKEWRHDELATDLAAHLRAGGGKMTWLNIAVGQAGAARPDVYTMQPWQYHSPELITYEVKISIADFRSDVTSGKWQKYLAFSQGVTFAAPSGMITKADVPKGCGLILRSERGWRHTVKPTLGKIDLPQDIWIKLVSTRPERTSPSRYGSAEDSMTKYYRDQAQREITARARQAIGKRYGEAIARYLEAPETAETMVRDARARAAEEIKVAKEYAKLIEADAAAGWRELAATLGLPPDTSKHLVRSAIRDRAAMLTERGHASHLLHAFKTAMATLESGAALARMAEALPPALPPTHLRHPSTTGPHGVMDKDMGAI